MKDKSIHDAIQNLDYQAQWSYLGATFLSRSRQLMRIIKYLFSMPDIQDLDEKFMAAVNLL